MRISNIEFVNRYRRRHVDAAQYIPDWEDTVSSATWRTPKEAHDSSSKIRHIGQGLLVFNVGRNRYRIVAEVDYRNQRLTVLFIGSHDEYDRARAIGVWR